MSKKVFRDIVGIRRELRDIGSSCFLCWSVYTFVREIQPITALR